jgi:glycosyltransferase involved in cell wall biosynthesis
MSKILFIVPHLSTGGMPQYTYWLIKTLLENTKHEIFLIEFNDNSVYYTVQRNRIKNILGEKLITLNKDNRVEYFKNCLDSISPNIIHFQEFPETWFPCDLCEIIYKNKHHYKIIETSHDSGFEPNSKKYFPDEFAFISDYHVEKFRHFKIPFKIIEYPIIKRERPDRDSSLFNLGLSPHHKHILNVGLFTPRKNQEEIFEIAKRMLDKKVLFHFVGNLAPNFSLYWQKLIATTPKNCRIWQERDDVDDFYKCMDLFLFTSKGTERDRETNPLVIKEALGWDMPILMYNLPVYNGKYIDNIKVDFLDYDLDSTCEKIIKKLDLK